MADNNGNDNSVTLVQAGGGAVAGLGATYGAAAAYGAMNSGDSAKTTAEATKTAKTAEHATAITAAETAIADAANKVDASVQPLLKKVLADGTHEGAKPFMERVREAAGLTKAEEKLPQIWEDAIKIDKVAAAKTAEETFASSSKALKQVGAFVDDWKASKSMFSAPLAAIKHNPIKSGITAAVTTAGLITAFNYLSREKQSELADLNPKTAQSIA